MERHCRLLHLLFPSCDGGSLPYAPGFHRSRPRLQSVAIDGKIHAFLYWEASTNCMLTKSLYTSDTALPCLRKAKPISFPAGKWKVREESKSLL